MHENDQTPENELTEEKEVQSDLTHRPIVMRLSNDL